MPNYILNNTVQANGDYEVHNTTTPCSYVRLIQSKTELGYHSSCHGAVASAKQKYPSRAKTINGCYYCCNPCHTS